jgi:putative transposase
VCVSDNGIELTGMANVGHRRCRLNGTTLRRANRSRIFIESFNGRLRDELLNETIFISLIHVRMAQRSGRTITTPSGRTVRSAICRPLSLPSVSGMQRDGALRYVEGSAPRPVAPPSQPGSNEARNLRIGG